MAKFKLVLLAAATIKTAQDHIRKDLVKLDQAVHDNAVQCLAHAAEHGDTSLMRRLLVDIIDKDSGYRQQGLIQWMRKHSPMELKKDNVDLSGIIESEAQAKAMMAQFPEVDPKLFVVGERRPFLVDEANAAPFRTDTQMREQVRPIFQQTLLSPLNAAAKRFQTACENTTQDEKGNPVPIDASKPYYDGKNQEQLTAFFDQLKAAQAVLPIDLTQERRERQNRIKNDLAAEQAEQKLAAAG